MKRKIWITALLVCCFFSLGYTSYAYFVAEKTSVNVITSGNIEIALLEWADLEKTIPYPKKQAVSVMPGTTVTKVVEIKNTGDQAAWVKIGVEKEKVSLDINTADWLERDGFYYYKKPLEAGKTTEPLFKEVSFLKETGNEYQNKQAVVEVKAYAVQVSNNGKTVWEAKGWPLAE